MDGRDIGPCSILAPGIGIADAIRLIADDYTREVLDVLALDRAMGRLPRARILQP